MGPSWISRILEKGGGGHLEKGGMNPLTNYDYLNKLDNNIHIYQNIRIYIYTYIYMLCYIQFIYTHIYGKNVILINAFHLKKTLRYSGTLTAPNHPSPYARASSNFQKPLFPLHSDVFCEGPLIYFSFSLFYITSHTCV